MSENLIHPSVPAEITYLAGLAGVGCEQFQQQIFDSKTTFVGPGELFVITYTVPENSSLIIMSLDIKMLYDITDAVFVGADFRATDDLNPYGPLAAGADVGQVRMLVDGLQQFQTAWDIGVINQSVMLIVGGGKELQIGVNPNQPAGETLVGVSVMRTYAATKAIGDILKKKETRIMTLPDVP